MRDKRTVDELSIEDLERILAVRKREARMQRFRGGDQRRVDVPMPANSPVVEKLPVPVQSSSLEALPPVPHIPTPYDDLPRFEDDLPALVEATPKRKTSDPTGSRQWRGTFNRFLLGIEVFGFAGLLVVLFIAYQGIQIVNENIEKTDSISATSEAELRSRLTQPTSTPLVSINAVVLPGGHVWAENAEPAFNLDEVPVAYRSTIQQQLDAPRTSLVAPPVLGAPIRIQIAKLGIDASVRAGDDWATLQAAVGHHPFSSNPGTGNTVLTGHNDIFGEIFRRLPELEIGDEIIIQAEGGMRYTYRVRESLAVDPTDTWVLGQSLGAQIPIVTLITCYPYRVNTKRWIIFAELVNS